MAKTESLKDALDIIQRRLCAIGLEDRVDARTYVHLVKHGLSTGRKMAQDANAIQQAFAESRSLCDIPGPLVFHRPEAAGPNVSAGSTAHLILSVTRRVREVAVEYLLRAEMGDCLSPHTLAKIKEMKEALFSRYRKRWIPAAVEVSDLLEDDWLLNYQGVLQSVKMNFDAGIADYLTRIMRPNTTSLGSMGRGILTPTEKHDEIRARIRQIAVEASTFKAALEGYYLSFGHIPLSRDLSVSCLYNEWTRKGNSLENVWDVFWEWTDSHTSPLPRYHMCCFFAENPGLIPANDKKRLVKEIVAVIASDEEAKGQWYNPWLTRCELARYYLEYLECRLPGANSEMISTQSWWLADKVASIYGNDPADIRDFRERAVESEAFRTSLAWQFTRLATAPSALRYATLYIQNMWSLSLVCQLSPETMRILLSAATEPQRKAIQEAVSGNLVNLFPIRHTDDMLVYAFDEGCVEVARALAESTEEKQYKEILTSFVDGVVKITGKAGVEEFLKRLPEGNAADQLLSVHAVHIEASMNRAPKEFIWDCLVDREWVKRVFGTLSPICAEHLFDGLKEIQLRTKGKWDEQLPHLYASLCEDLHEKTEKRRLFFAFAVISSLASGSVSAVDRLLKGGDRFDYKEDVDDWRQRIEHINPLVPQWCRARLRAMLASLHV